MEPIGNYRRLLFERFPVDRFEVRSTSWGTREFHVRDLDRNGLQFYRDL